jgi:acyl-CoA synthetase (AMP-forming)/AMP-acid ligase II
VCGVPQHLSQEYVLQCFRRGWEHTLGDTGAGAGAGAASAAPAPCQGFYIGREHAPFTEVRVVRSVTRGAGGYLEDCPAGRPGYLVTRGGHVFSSYVGLPAETGRLAVSDDGWYLNLGDIGFWLPAQDPAPAPAPAGRGGVDEAKELYWQSRESQMLIRGGANYAFEQVHYCNCTVLCYAVLCYTVLCYAMLCCSMI